MKNIDVLCPRIDESEKIKSTPKEGIIEKGTIYRQIARSKPSSPAK